MQHARRASLTSEYELRDSVSGLKVGETTSDTGGMDIDTAPLFFLAPNSNADSNSIVEVLKSDGLHMHRSDAEEQHRFVL